MAYRRRTFLQIQGTAKLRQILTDEVFDFTEGNIFSSFDQLFQILRWKFLCHIYMDKAWHALAKFVEDFKGYVGIKIHVSLIPNIHKKVCLENDGSKKSSGQGVRIHPCPVQKVACFLRYLLDWWDLRDCFFLFLWSHIESLLSVHDSTVTNL